MLVVEGAGVAPRRRNSRPSSPNRSRRRPCDGRPGGRWSRRRSARSCRQPGAAALGRAPSATAIAARRAPATLVRRCSQPARAEIALRQHVGCHLRPLGRHVDADLAERRSMPSGLRISRSAARNAIPFGMAIVLLRVYRRSKRIDDPPRPVPVISIAVRGVLLGSDRARRYGHTTDSKLQKSCVRNYIL